MTKVCTECGVEKLLDGFHLAALGRQGRAAKCKDCKNHQIRAHYQANRETLIAQKMAYRRTNDHAAQAHREAVRRYVERNHEAVLAKRRARHHIDYIRQREWTINNRDRRCANENRRRAQMQRCVAGQVSAEQINARWAMWGNCCWMCGSVATATDHVKPLAAGGPHLAANLRPSCSSCNSRKGKQWDGLNTVSTLERKWLQSPA